MLSNPISVTPTPGDNSTMRGDEEITVEDFTRTGMTLWETWSRVREKQWCVRSFCHYLSLDTDPNVFRYTQDSLSAGVCGSVWSRCVMIMPQYWCWLRSRSSVLWALCGDGVMMKCCHPECPQHHPPSAPVTPCWPHITHCHTVQSSALPAWTPNICIDIVRRIEHTVKYAIPNLLINFNTTLICLHVSHPQSIDNLNYKMSWGRI